jgi:hypothetical protein
VPDTVLLIIAGFKSDRLKPEELSGWVKGNAVADGVYLPFRMLYGTSGTTVDYLISVTFLLDFRVNFPFFARW